RALSSHPWVEPTVIKLPFDARPRPTAWVPGGRNWSVRASLMARRGLAQRLRQGALDAVFVHTQVAALLSTGLFARVPTVISLDATPRDFDEVGFAYGHRRQARRLEELKAALNRRALAGATAGRTSLPCRPWATAVPRSWRKRPPAGCPSSPPTRERSAGSSGPAPTACWCPPPTRASWRLRSGC